MAFAAAARNAAAAVVTQEQVERTRTEILDAIQNVAIEDELDGLERLQRMTDAPAAGSAPLRTTEHVPVTRQRTFPHALQPPDPFERASDAGSGSRPAEFGGGAGDWFVPEYFLRLDDASAAELVRLNERLTKELARGDLAGRNDAADLDAATEQDKESIFQSMWSYASLAIVSTCLGFGVTEATLLVLLAFFFVLHLLVSIMKGYVSAVITRMRNNIVAGKPILIAWAAQLSLIFGLLSFAIVTSVTGSITPILREMGPYLTGFVQLVCVAAIVISTCCALKTPLSISLSLSLGHTFSSPLPLTAHHH